MHPNLENYLMYAHRVYLRFNVHRMLWEIQERDLSHSDGMRVLHSAPTLDELALEVPPLKKD